jgi:tellurite methyltransferase
VAVPRETLMPRAPLVECRLLDPRPAAQARSQPIDDAVNIPVAELAQRTYELPAREDLILVAGPTPWADEAVAWLLGHGRRAAIEPDFQYRDNPPAVQIGRLWRPNPFLAEVLPRLTPSHALDLACGVGREAVFAAACGWRVVGVDVLPDALERARQLAERCAPAIEQIDWRKVDLERDPQPFETRFDLIFAFRYLHRPLLGRLAEWLNPGGSVIYETFTTLHRQRHRKPVGDEHVLRPAELPDLLAGLELRHYSEAWHGTAHTARAWAVRQ